VTVPRGGRVFHVASDVVAPPTVCEAPMGATMA
jgi:hypothetical protein